MLIKVAWRNIWRNKLRSLVVIFAVAIGLLAGVFASAFVVGMIEQKIDSVIELEMSHFQIHHSKFRDEQLPKYLITDSKQKIDHLLIGDSVIAVSDRVVITVMMNSPNKNGAIKIIGIDPKKESQVTVLHKRVKIGSYFETENKNPILVSQKMADEYKLSLRSKVVLTMQDIDSEIISGAFRVVGIYDSGNAMYDEFNAFILKKDVQRLLGIGDEVHEIAVLLNAHESADPMANSFQKLWPDHEVKSWADLSPGMRYFIGAIDLYTMIIVGIILTALLFIILNIMLMAVLERFREIGMLMAIGMNKVKIFGMIILETLFLSLIGGPFGMFLSWILIGYFGKAGINLGDAAYEDVGFANVIYPQLELDSYLSVATMVVVMAFLASIYPAIKALRLKPVEAIGKA